MEARLVLVRMRQGRCVLALLPRDGFAEDAAGEWGVVEGWGTWGVIWKWKLVGLGLVGAETQIGVYTGGSQCEGK